MELQQLTRRGWPSKSLVRSIRESLLDSERTGALQYFFRSGSAGDCERRQLIKSYLSQCGYSIDNCNRNNNLTIKRPARAAFEKRWKSWRNRTASNCEGHKNDTAGSSTDRSEDHGQMPWFRSFAMHVVDVTLPKRSMTGQRVGFESAAKRLFNKMQVSG